MIYYIAAYWIITGLGVCAVFAWEDPDKDAFDQFGGIIFMLGGLMFPVWLFIMLPPELIRKAVVKYKTTQSDIGASDE